MPGIRKVMYAKLCNKRRMPESRAHPEQAEDTLLANRLEGAAPQGPIRVGQDYDTTKRKFETLEIL